MVQHPPINQVIHQIKRMKNKNQMIISTDTEEVANINIFHEKNSLNKL